MKINEVIMVNEDGVELARALMTLSGEEIFALSAALTMTVPVLKGLFKTGKGIMKVKRMMDRASVRIANGVVKETTVNEIEYSSDVQKDDMSKFDLDDMVGSTESTGKKIKGYEIHTIGDDEGDVSFLVKDQSADGFLGELRLKAEHKYAGMRKSVVFFDEEIQGKGIAVPLYKMAIVDFGHTIVSDYQQSKGSKTIWERLAKTPGIFVYGWNPREKGDKEFFQWDPTEDSDSAIYQGQSSTDPLRDELDALMQDIGRRKQSGELSPEQANIAWEEGKKEISAELKDADLVRYNDIRLVATADDGLNESLGSLMGMISPAHRTMYKKAVSMMVKFHDEFPSYGLNKLAELVKKRTARDLDRRAMVNLFKKLYPSMMISEHDIKK